MKIKTHRYQSLKLYHKKVLRMTAQTEMEHLLEDLQRSLRHNYVPLITLLTVFGIIGIFGNSLTIYFYCFKTKRSSSTIVFITFLAIVDLCLSFSIGLTVLHLMFNVSFENELVCKTMQYIFKSLSLLSALILLVIAIDRYLKICRQLGSQFSEQSAKVCVIVLFMMSVLFSIKYFFSYEIITYEIVFANTTVNASSCTRTEGNYEQSITTAFYIFDFVVVVIMIGTFIFTYGNISKQLREHKNATKKNSFQKRPIGKLKQGKCSGGTLKMNRTTTSTKPQEKKENCLESVHGNNIVHATESYLQTNLNENHGQTKSAKAKFKEGNTILDKPAGNITKVVPSDRRITTLMIVLTTSLCISYVPYIVWCVEGRKDSEARNTTLTASIQFLKRTPFINAAINPIVFFIYNPEYRMYVLDMFRSKTI